MADTNTIKVRGHLEERASTNGKTNGLFYRMMLEWTDEDGNRQRKSKTTGLPVKGNKTKAKEMLDKTIKERETFLNDSLNKRVQGALSVDGKPEGTLFADFIEHDWLEAVRRGDRKAVKKKVVLGTFGGYQLNVTKHIAPYFRERGILLSELTADDINDYYDYQYNRTVKNTGKPIKAMTVTKHHANIYSSLQYASRKNYIDSADSILKNVLRPEAEEFLAKPYNEDEAVKLIEAVRGDSLELSVIIGAFYGLRRSEVIGLRWDCVKIGLKIFIR